MESLRDQVSLSSLSRTTKYAFQSRTMTVSILTSETKSRIREVACSVHFQKLSSPCPRVSSVANQTVRRLAQFPKQMHVVRIHNHECAQRAIYSSIASPMRYQPLHTTFSFIPSMAFPLCSVKPLLSSPNLLHGTSSGFWDFGEDEPDRKCRRSCKDEKYGTRPANDTVHESIEDWESLGNNKG